MNKNIFVNEDSAGTRLDRWFKRNISNVPQSLIEKNVRKGNIKVNNKKIKSSYKLKFKDNISLKNINFQSNKSNNNENSYKATKKDISYSTSFFIENNDNFVVINKPSGIAVQSGTKSKRNILDILKYTKEFIDFYPYAVHRIDKETSGVLIVAKNRKYAQLFTSLFRIRKIHKIYLAIVHGEFKDKKGTFEDLLFYYENNKKIKMKAITHFKVINSNNNYTFLELIPETGRKHQLRKQLLIHGYPIVGDEKYNFINSKNKKKSFMLHAYKIFFSISGIKYNFMANIPKKFKEFLYQKYLKSF